VTPEFGGRLDRWLGSGNPEDAPLCPMCDAVLDDEGEVCSEGCGWSDLRF
jgi:hypothetical protein